MFTLCGCEQYCQYLDQMAQIGHQPSRPSMVLLKQKRACLSKTLAVLPTSTLCKHPRAELTSKDAVIIQLFPKKSQLVTDFKLILILTFW
jgi:hypothetical protein